MVTIESLSKKDKAIAKGAADGYAGAHWEPPFPELHLLIAYDEAYVAGLKEKDKQTGSMHGT